MKTMIGQRLVLATHNGGKLVEIANLLAPFGIETISAADLGLDEPEETEDTFTGNARIKAQYAAKNSGLPALSDDSGIMVDGLGGAPGIYTANWAETPNGRDFNVAMTRVWTMLDARSAPDPRTARFMCALCLAWPDGQDNVFEGKVEGTLVWPLRGGNGFGFDPMFLPVGEKLTFGEMDPARKHKISHRADAFSKFTAALGHA